MYQRDIPTFTRIGFSVKEASDFSPTGYINIIERLEKKSGHTAWARELLTAERRAYMARFAISSQEQRERDSARDRDIIGAFKARAYAEARG